MGLSGEVYNIMVAVHNGIIQRSRIIIMYPLVGLYDFLFHIVTLAFNVVTKCCQNQFIYMYMYVPASTLEFWYSNIF